MKNSILELDAFVRSIRVNRSTPHMLFLGAGASISSGIPSAEMCIWEWKRDIFLTKNPGLEDQFVELSLPSVRNRIQRWLDAQGVYPKLGAIEEYGFYIEYCFPISEDRRSYFEKKVKSAKPSIGYKLICLMAESQIIQSVWTTNFDDLVAREARNYELVPIEIGIESKNRLSRQPRREELLCISLHGDYRYDKLKNTPSELQQQDGKLRNALVEHAQDMPLIVCGYSGRDASIMRAFKEVYSKEGAGSLYWCGYAEKEIPESVKELIEIARANGRSVYYVPTFAFDDLFKRLSLHCLEGDKIEIALGFISEIVDQTQLEVANFYLNELQTVGVIKSNAFEVDCPSEVLEFGLKKWPAEKTWSWLREVTKDKGLVAVPFKRKVLSIGTIDAIKEAFGENLDGQIKRIPISDKDLRYENGIIISLLRQALISSMAMAAEVGTDRKKLLWELEPYETRLVGDRNCYLYKSAILFLRRIGDRNYLIIKPSINVMDESGLPVPKDIENQIKINIFGWQHNKEFNQDLERWRGRLLPKGRKAFEFPPDCGSTFKFRLSRVPVFAKIGLRTKQKQMLIKTSFQQYLRQLGTELKEPLLVFSNKMANGFVKDTHPIRGIVQNQPFDYSLTYSGLAQNVKIGIVCPKKESHLLDIYLHEVHKRHKRLGSEREYLMDFPGFENVYGLSIEIPQPSSTGWIDCPEPDENLDKKAGSLELARRITRSVDALQAAYVPNVVLIFIPDRWNIWTGFEEEEESFDLHNFVKAFSIQRGIATQFLQEDTLRNRNKCRVWWWLSLALYVKSMRTPWVLDSLDPDTAFVGLGFSLHRQKKKGKHVVLGCSHIYNAQGQGLQFRLSKIENPVIHQGNPFMSEEDARNVGEKIRYLFYESRLKLPHRVVIHKLTPFTREEQEGLRTGLSGVKIVDMLEIHIDDALRYVASVPKRGGGFDEDNYPVKRGTLVQLDRYTALLWVHGVTTYVHPQLRYYQGKRRIPAPIVIRRNIGRSDLRVIAEEILGLSKMDWNTFDLYSKLPATIRSSNQIARIGTLLQRFEAASYDYRLFI